MTSELIAVFDYFEKEKGIDRETMVEALETALLSACRRSVGPARELRIDVNAEKGIIRAKARLLVVEDGAVEDPFEELALSTAQKVDPSAVLGGEVEVDVTPADFGRIAAQTAKQAMMQRLRQAEKELIYDEFKDRAGDIVGGTVRRFERSDVIIDLGKFEGVMPGKERVSTEDYNVGDRIRAYVVAVENGARGPEIILSRSHPNFVRRLFEAEVSEIADRTVEIKAIAREAGYRTKVAVHAPIEPPDPVGACVGLRGARVKNIVRELNNEKVDIIRYSENVEEFVADALKPAVIRSITVVEDEDRVQVTVDEEELSKAIGRRGQNARLTSKLVGWDVQIDRDESKEEQFAARVQEVVDSFVNEGGMDQEVASQIVLGGINDVDTLLSVDADDIAAILGCEPAEAAPILAKAQAQLGGESRPEAAEETAEAAEETSTEPASEEATEAEPEGGEDAPVEDSTDGEGSEEETSQADEQPEEAEEAEAEEGAEEEPAEAATEEPPSDNGEEDDKRDEDAGDLGSSEEE